MSITKFPFRDGFFEFLGDTDESLKKEIVDHIFFQRWANRLDKSIILKTIKLQSYIRGDDGKIKYIKIDTITERNGGKIPRIIIFEGFAISVLIVLHSIETKIAYVVLENKILIATGSFQNIVPLKIVGALEPDENTAVKFIKDETGIDSIPNEIIDLPKKATNNQISYTYLYCGPTDLINKIYMLEKDVHENFIKELDGREIRPNETLKVVPLDNVEQYIQDFVSIVPLSYYQKLHTT